MVWGPISTRMTCAFSLICNATGDYIASFKQGWLTTIMATALRGHAIQIARKSPSDVHKQLKHCPSLTKHGSTSFSGCSSCMGIPIPMGNSKQDPEWYHGTHVAGLVGATQNNGLGITGLAPGVKLMILRVRAAWGSGWTADAACLQGRS